MSAREPGRGAVPAVLAAGSADGQNRGVNRPHLRRVVAGGLCAVLLAAGCSSPAEPAADPQPDPQPTPSAAAPSSAAVALDPLPVPERAAAVGTRRLTVTRGSRELPVTLWYPANGSGGTSADAVPAPGRFPVVVFSHGLGAAPADYRQLLVRWARAGFVIAAPTFPSSAGAQGPAGLMDVLKQPADVSAVLTEVLALDGRAGDLLAGHLHTDRVAAAGHSAGGVTTVGLFTTGRDDRLRAGVVLAGSALGVGTAFAGAAAPQLFVHGERDDVVSYASGRAAYEAVPWPKAMLSLPEGDHGASMSDPDSPGFRVVSQTVLDFLYWTLYGDPAARQRLSAGGERGKVGVLDAQL